MAGHLPLKVTNLHLKLVKEFKKNVRLQNAKFFDRFNVYGFVGYFQRLPDEYKMDEETGLKDCHIFFYCGDEQKDEYFEIHLDNKMKVNQVYLVM